MSKSKNDSRKRSKASKVLKAAGVAGVVLGGTMMDANVVLAAEFESNAQEASESETMQDELQWQSDLQARASQSEVVTLNSQMEDLEAAAADVNDVVNSDENADADLDVNGEVDADEKDNLLDDAKTDGNTESGEDTNPATDTTDSEETEEKPEPVVSQTSEEAESMSVVNSDSEKTDSENFTSESLSVFTSASNSASTVKSVSESNSASAEVSESLVVSESVSTSEAISESESLYEDKSTTYQTGSNTVEMGSALSEYDAAVSEINSTSNSASEAGVEVDLTAQQKAVAEKIIRYDVVQKGWTLNGQGIVWEPNGEYYTVYYKDANGVELNAVYQYEVVDNEVKVFEAEIKYGATDGTKEVNNTDKTNADGTEESIDKNNAPEVSYKVENSADGSTNTTITVGGVVYKNPDRQINPDGSISYILFDYDENHDELAEDAKDVEEKKINGTNNEMKNKLFVISADGTNGYYMEYNESGAAYDLSKIGTSNFYRAIRVVEVSGNRYLVTQGTIQTVVIQDQNGDFHELVLENHQFTTFEIF